MLTSRTPLCTHVHNSVDNSKYPLRMHYLIPTLAEVEAYELKAVGPTNRWELSIFLVSCSEISYSFLPLSMMTKTSSDQLIHRTLMEGGDGLARHPTRRTLVPDVTERGEHFITIPALSADPNLVGLTGLKALRVGSISWSTPRVACKYIKQALKLRITGGYGDCQN